MNTFTHYRYFMSQFQMLTILKLVTHLYFIQFEASECFYTVNSLDVCYISRSGTKGVR